MIFLSSTEKLHIFLTQQIYKPSPPAVFELRCRLSKSMLVKLAANSQNGEGISSFETVNLTRHLDTQYQFPETCISLHPTKYYEGILN